MKKSKHRIRIHEQWARLRFLVVGTLWAAPPAKGDLRARIDELAKRVWVHPKTGEPTMFSRGTIRRWYYLGRRADNPIDKLRRKTRVDAGSTYVMGAAVRQAAREQYSFNKNWSVKLHHDNLVELAEVRPELKPMPSYTTLRRYFKSQGFDKRRRVTSRQTEGAERSEARREQREMRSYEVAEVGALGHWDCHKGSKKVLLRGEWRTPVLFGIIDDHSRMVTHLQWYLAENAENIAHGMSQAFLKHGLPKAVLSDNGTAMTATEIDNGLTALSIVHERTLPYTPESNGKIEHLWSVVEGRLIAMLDNTPDLTLGRLNEITQIWVERDYNDRTHSETDQTPRDRFRTSPTVMRRRPEAEAVRMAFTRSDHRTVRRSDGTISLEGRRFEIPNRYRHFEQVEIRYASWDLDHVHLIHDLSGGILCRLYPQDKVANADGRRRTLDPVTPETAQQPSTASPRDELPPLLARMMRDHAATGRPPAYLPKDELEDDDDLGGNT